jgi:hypothetical protein
MCLYGSLFSSSPSYTVAGCSEWQCRCTAFGCSPLPFFFRGFPPFLSSFVGSYTPAYKGRGPHPHRWYLSLRGVYPPWVIYGPPFSCCSLPAGRHRDRSWHTLFTSPAWGDAARQTRCRTTGLNGWASTATTRLGLVCQWVLVVPTGHLGSPQASNIILHKGDLCRYSGELDDIGGRPPPAPPRTVIVAICCDPCAFGDEVCPQPLP